MDLFDIDQFDWKHYQSSGPGSFKIDYWSTILRADESGRVELLYRWEPNAHCHFHRHRAHTTSIVLKGELHVADYNDDKATTSRVRPAGHRAHSEGNEVHREWGGPEGALVYFSLLSKDGALADQLDEDGQIIRTITVADVLRASAS